MNKLKKNIHRALAVLVNKNRFVKEASIRVRDRLRRVRYRLLYYRCPVQDNLVIFESYLGGSFACSPKALYLAMRDNGRLGEYEAVWAFKEPEKYKFLEEYPATRVIGYKSKEYYRCYSRAKFWVSNYRVPTDIKKKPEQIYVQTWHGTPFKKIGCDVYNTQELKAVNDRRHNAYIRDAARFTYMLSPSEFYTSKMVSAFGLDRLGKEHICIEKGYPRNDRLYTHTKDDAAAVKKKLQIEDGRKVVLYAPTWRDNQHTPGVGYTYSLGLDLDRLRERLGDEYRILFRTHYLVRNSIDFERYRDFITDVSGVDDINDLYIASDLLLTDYSSVFFDYAVLNRPIVFYMYDLDEYKGELRDFYFGLDELPGPIVRDQEALCDLLDKDLNGIVDPDRQKRFNSKFNPHQGPCSKAVLDFVLERAL